MNFTLGDTTYLKIIVIGALYLYLPLTAFTFYFFRKHRKNIEIDRVFDLLQLDEKYKAAYNDKKLPIFFISSVAYVSFISFIGFTLLFLSTEFDINNFGTIEIGEEIFPAPNSRFMCAMSFLGSYIWGVQHIFRRFMVNDLFPAVYYRLSVRMLLSVFVTLIIFNTYDALSGDGAGVAAKAWPALAFFIGMFPKRGLIWLSEKVPLLSSETNPSLVNAPLELIEGITMADKMRLEEEGIDSCYDLAPSDFIPLVLQTPYGARELADWIMQAKLCVYFGSAVKDLRQQGIRRITDLKYTDDSSDLIDDLALKTAVTKEAIERARKWLGDNKEEIERLQEVEKKLGRFSKK